jgi:hypothetical protein
MPKRIGDHPLSNAERQARFKAKKKAEGLNRNYAWTSPELEKKAKSNEQWQADLREETRQERIKAARKEGRNSVRMKYLEYGRIDGIISVCDFIVQRQRPDIAKSILKKFMVTRKRCEAAGFDTFKLSILDKALVFDD